jgi:hypothetical protein
MILTGRRNTMATHDKNILKSQLQAENALRRATIDRLIKAKIDDGALEPQASKESTALTSPPVSIFEVGRKHS